MMCAEEDAPMGYQCFDVNVDEKIAHIVLSRPEKRNSMTPEFWDELPAIIRDIDDARSTVHMMFYIWFPGGLADEGGWKPSA